MLKKYLPGILALVLITAYSHKAVSGPPPVGEKRSISDFTLTDYNGVKHALSDYKEAKGIVVMFIATRCPVSNAYNGRMAALYADYQKRGFAFVGINSNKAEAASEIKEHAGKNHLAFTILKDPGNLIADKFGATVTPEIFVLSNELQLLYHGRIDDSRREANVKSKDLRDTLDAILAGKSVPVTETKAFGCSIKRIKKDT